MHLHSWQLLSAFGDPFLTLPLAGIILCWLALSGQRRVALAWALFFCLAVTLVGLSKFAYAGWGVHISSLHFTVISGHTMLSSAVYPLALYLCAQGRGARTAHAAALVGVLFALVIGVSRVMVGAHSQSEVVIGALLGLAVSSVSIRTLARAAQPLAPTLRFVLLCAATTFACYGHAAPIQQWVVKTAPQLSQLLAHRL
jgi:membrane-associated phospholipid phosphatase